MIFLMKELIISLLDMTAWRMDTPELFGGFHICAALFTVAAAVCVAAGITKRIKAAEPPGKDFTGIGAGAHGKSHTDTGTETAENDPNRKLIRILAGTGWVLVVLELYKQLFLYHVVNGGAYDWWYFPFQLCSVPMYLCILLPLVPRGVQKTFLTFMGGYTFISAAAALIYPADMLRPYAALTLHGFIWHGLLLFISLLIFMTGSIDPSVKGIAWAAGLFAALSLTALMINIAVEPLMQAAYTSDPGIFHSWAAMFYLNPYHISPQPLVGTIQKTAGIPAGLLLYSLVTAIAGSFFISLSGRKGR